MARGNLFRFSLLALSNVLLPIAVSIFATGFFPYKPVLPGLATFHQPIRGSDRSQPVAVFDRVVFMVVDALRSDFVYGFNSGFQFTQSLIRSGAAIPFTAHANPPTVTMPRVKALTTGSVPSFLDLILNFAENDATSSLAAQDTWLAQLKAKGGQIVFYGDDTWLKLFPSDHFFLRSDGTSSFFVSDFTEVDNNVTRHVPHELLRTDWNAMIMHYLGLDHIGHKTGPQGPNMLPKQREMDGIVERIYTAIETIDHQANTLLIVAGDHGMNAGGNHGGSGPGETEPALLFVSPKLKEIPRNRSYECPTLPKESTEFHYYNKIEQSDLVPTLSNLMGIPISKNSLGVSISDFASLWPEEQWVELLRQNAEQMLQIVHAKYGAEAFKKEVLVHRRSLIESGEYAPQPPSEDRDQLAWKWALALHRLETESASRRPELVEQALLALLTHAQEAMSDTASSYGIPRMVTGMILAAVALVTGVFSLPSVRPLHWAGVSFSVLCSLYGFMMFASSYVEEEQRLWYWLTPMWIMMLCTAANVIESIKFRKYTKLSAGCILLMTHRIAIRWNQTGQKYAGEPDIVHTFFPQHHVLMWLLILATYIVNGYFLHNRSFTGIFMPELAVFALVCLTTCGIVFKLNLTQADSPELVRGLAARIREHSEPFSLVFQARVVFSIVAVTALAVLILTLTHVRAKFSDVPRQKEESVPMAERLHHVLTVFLMAQTRAPNVPLYLVFEIQRASLQVLLQPDHLGDLAESSDTRRVTQIATTALLLSHVYYFCMGGSNSISSIDLSNAYNGVTDYNIAAVGILLFASNWSAPIWWCSAAVLMMSEPKGKTEAEAPTSEETKAWIKAERVNLHTAAKAALMPARNVSGQEKQLRIETWTVYLSAMTAFVSMSLLFVMAACTALRTHLFIWTVFSPKYLYAMAWAVGWHLVINLGLGSCLYHLSLTA